jgi:hypothetical protein
MCGEGSCSTGGDPGVRRRRSIEGKGNSEGRSPEGGGADGGDARTESDAEDGSGGRKVGEADAESVGKHVWCSGMDG